MINKNLRARDKIPTDPTVRSADQARKAFEAFVSAAQKAAEKSPIAIPAGVKELNAKIMTIAQTNAKAAFDHAEALVKATDSHEALQLQTEYLKAQMTALQEQAKELVAATTATIFTGASSFVSVDQITRHFDTSRRQAAETTSFRHSSFTDSRDAQARAGEMLEIVNRIANWAGGEKQALAWYRAEPIPAFGDRTAEALVKEGKAAAVRDWLDHVALGGFA